MLLAFLDANSFPPLRCPSYPLHLLTTTSTCVLHPFTARHQPLDADEAVPSAPGSAPKRALQPRSSKASGNVANDLV